MTTKRLLKNYIRLRDELAVQVDEEPPRKCNDAKITGKWPTGEPMDDVLGSAVQVAAMNEVGNA